MNTTTAISAILTLLAGIGIFLIACQMMSTNLESASSSKLKKLFEKVNIQCFFKKRSPRMNSYGLWAAQDSIAQPY